MSHLTRRTLPIALASALACRGTRVVDKPSPPPTAPAAAGAHAVATANGIWTSTGPAFANQVCIPPTTASLRAASGLGVARVGGDYWITKLPYDDPLFGGCRFDSSIRSGDGGSIESPEFVSGKQFLTFLVAGGGRPETRVELWRTGAARPVFTELGPGVYASRRVFWDLAEARLLGQRLKLRVTDDSADAARELAALDTRDRAACGKRQCEEEVERAIELRRRSFEGRSQTGMAAIAFAGPDFVDDAGGAAGPGRLPVWGAADLHTHPMSHLAFGGSLFYGAPDGELQPCSLERHGVTTLQAGLAYSEAEKSVGGAGLRGHGTAGPPGYDDWPRWSTKIHQQMREDQLRRAWRGGIRLIVAHAVNNEVLARLVSKPPSRTDDEGAIELQIKGMKQFAARHSDFMGIAQSPAEARAIIEAGKLAVVLGVEVDSLVESGCKGGCNEADVMRRLDDLRAKGVRHIFPIHLADNVLGGAAIYDSRFNYLNASLRGVLFEVAKDPDASIHFRLETSFVLNAGFLMERFVWLRFPDSYGVRAHMNKKGLTPLGELAVRHALTHGMMVDADHMSQLSVAASLSVAKELGKPLVFGHTGPRELRYAPPGACGAGGCATAQDRMANEYDKSLGQFEELRDLGGVVGLLAYQGDVRAAPRSLPADCEGSSRSWLHAYVATIRATKGRPIAIGTDINGLAGLPLPRFGPQACLLRLTDDGFGDPDSLRIERGRNASATLRANAEAQGAAVSYRRDQQFREGGRKRFWRVSPRNASPYSFRETFIWEAVGAYKAGVRPQDLDLPDVSARELNQPGDLNDFEIAILTGLRSTADEPPAPGDELWDVRRAARLLKLGREPGNGASFAVRRAYQELLPVWKKWREMEVGANEAAPLERYRLGAHQFDYNVEGLAHYGLLPDFFQDVANQLRSQPQDGEVRDLGAFFRSAEAYLQAWERVAGEPKSER